VSTAFGTLLVASTFRLRFFATSSAFVIFARSTVAGMVITRSVVVPLTVAVTVTDTGASMFAGPTGNVVVCAPCGIVIDGGNGSAAALLVVSVTGMAPAGAKSGYVRPSGPAT
jgi:hypothetical protein